MMVDGEPKLTCKEALSSYGDTVEISPLANFPVIRDLVVELDGFMEKLKSVKPWIIRAKERAVEEGPMRQSPEELAEFKQFSYCINCMLCYSACPVVSNEPEFIGPAAIALGHRYNIDSRDEGAAELAEFKQFSMCINCMLCYSACPVVANEAEFLGPAAIALGHRYNLDSRDQGQDERNEIFRGEGTVFSCSFANECSEVCPKNVDPAAAVNQAKFNAVIDWAKNLVLPRGAARGGRGE